MNSPSGARSAPDRESNPPNGVSSPDEVREHLIEVADILAKVLDTTVKVPGTSLYIGLDPLLGLIPGVGDALANLIGTVILGLAARLRIPRIVLARMSLNLLINGSVGAIPIAGDLFSVWFRSHARNAALLREAATQLDCETRSDWFYVGGIIAGAAVLLLLVITIVLWLIFAIWTRLAP